MRDIAITAIVLWGLFHALKHPYYGLLLWIWLSIMNPHRMAYGFAYDTPFAMLVAVVTLGSVVLNFGKLEKFTLNGTTVTMIIFMLWLCVSPSFSLHPEFEYPLWSRAMKVQLMVLVTVLVVGNRKQLDLLMMVLTLSIGFYGIKGGLFTIASGGSYRVWGPEGSFIEDNNHLALATIMAVPLFRYLQLQAANLWARRGYLAALLLCTISALGSHSRGALLAVAAMGFFLWLKTRNKVVVGLIVLAIIPLVLAVAPENWTERMQSIKTYDQDASAMGRINAWWVAWNLAVDRFPIGGGFGMWEADVFAKYAPDPADIHVAHSIYFQVLGEQGFMGLFLFLLIFTLAWFHANRVLRMARGRSDLLWARDLASMAQVSLIGYAVGGAFLSLSYFDLPYYVVIVIVILHEVVKRQSVKPVDPAGTARLASQAVVASPPRGLSGSRR